MKLRHVTLRDLFWLVLVVALGLGWWLDRREQRKRWLQQVESANQQLLKFDHQLRVYHDKEDDSLRVLRIVR